jgi:Ca2+-binding RTX toxin-like protein
MAANPDSAFTAGWIATFARVNELKLNQVGASDFLGGLAGYLDSVGKAGLGFDAANVAVKIGGNGVTLEIKVPNGAEIPGALSAFASQTSQSSDASGTTVKLVFSDFLASAGFHGFAAWQGSGDSVNNWWFGADVANNHNAGASAAAILVGGASTDTLTGGQGWDFLDGGAGNDILIGGDVVMKRAHQAVIPVPRTDRNRGANTRRHFRGSGWRPAKGAAASMTCIYKRLA